MNLPGATILPSKSTSNGSLIGEYHTPTALYSTGHTFMDFSVDDNGLWIIYSMENSNNTAVAKVII